MTNEADTCRKFVVPNLQSAGWDNEPHSIAEQRSITDGRVIPVGKGFVRKPPNRDTYLYFGNPIYEYPINRETDAVLTRRQPMLDYLQGRNDMTPAELNPSLEQVAAYLLAWRAREGSFLSAPSAARLPPDYAEALDERLGSLLAGIDLPARIISRHPGVSAAALQSLLTYFRSRRKPVEELLPSTPESDDAYPRLIAIFHRINKHVYPAFFPAGAIPVHALVTIATWTGSTSRHGQNGMRC